MAVDFRSATIRFDPTKRREQTESTAVVFGRPVTRAEVALRGFNCKFTEGDHHFFQHKIQTGITRIEDRTVFVQVGFLLCDNSGDIDDLFNGSVDVLVLAEVE